MKLLTPAHILEHFGLSRFTCLDFETTGLEPASCEIIEIGAVKVEEGQITEEFHSLVSIEGELPEAITYLTGISPHDLEGQPSFSRLLPDLIEFLQNLPIVAHNLAFDLGFLKEMLLRCGEFNVLQDLALDSDKHWDLLLLARMLYPLFRSHRLEYLMEVFQINGEIPHRALEDCKGEVQVFDRLLLKALTIPNETLASLRWITQGRKKFYSRFIKALHEFRTQSHVQAPAPSLASAEAAVPPSMNVLRRKKERSEKGDFTFHPEEVIAVFDRQGLLSQSLSSYEVRYEQIDMVKEICRAYENEEFLLAEAGTGTGKSYAYLVPAIFWSQAHPLDAGRTIVSTNTRNLQDQIFYKDLPFLYAQLPVDFQAVLLKGRNNYLCFNRWNNYLRQIDFARESDEIEQILPLLVWVNETRTGDIEELNWFNPQKSARLWWQIQSEGYYCSGHECRYKEKCFVNRARRAAREADVVVINHSLLLSDLISDNAVLSDYQNLVVDEAHNLENTATQYLGVEWSVWSFLRPLSGLMPEQGETSTELEAILWILSRQAWLEEYELKTIQHNIEQVKNGAVQLKEANNNFFQRLSLYLTGLLLERNGYPRKIRYKNWLEEYPALQDVTNTLIESLEFLVTQLTRLINNLVAIQVSRFSREDFEQFKDRIAFMKGTEATFLTWKDVVWKLLVENSMEFVYWLEPSRRRENWDIHFRSAPLEVAGVLKNLLYSKLRTAIFTSATLSVNQEFRFFENYLGIDRLPEERHTTKLVGSPFNYEEQVLVLVPKFVPHPGAPQFNHVTSEVIEKSLTQTHRSTLILFTSYKMLDRIYENLHSNLRFQDVTAIAQGRSGSRNNLLRMLKEGKAQALFGTHSFWEGVDLPGTALEILIITKLPFDVPTEPVVAARMERIEQQGGNSFYEYSVPNAVLKFRQGFGRLIRSRRDRGVVVLLDSRLLTARYGTLFLNSMPVQPTIPENLDEYLQILQNWF